MKAHLTGKNYSFEIETEEMVSLLKAEDFLVFPSLSDRLLAIPGVHKVEYNGHFGAQVSVSFEIGKDDEAIGFEDARDMIEIHLGQCDAFLIYVADTQEEARGKSLLHSGDGFVLCNATTREGKDLGVSLHFLDNGDRQTKWFTDGAAEQFRELAVIGDARRIRAIVAKQIDLDPVSAPRP